VKPRPNIRAGFTLVELMVTSALAGIVMAAILSTFGFMGRNLSRLASYQALENEARKGLAYLRQDFALAKSIKSGTSPTASNVTLVLPAGEVTYSYDSGTRRLTRTATFGVNPTFSLLQNSQCECTAFKLEYFTTTDAAPTDQSAPATNVPYSIKQIQVGFTLESPTTWTSLLRTRYEAASSRFFIRNRTAPDGS
jgi:prepilin-type N-terminal cleavage/methylation domain-containing protein